MGHQGSEAHFDRAHYIQKIKEHRQWRNERAYHAELREIYIDRVRRDLPMRPGPGEETAQLPDFGFEADPETMSEDQLQHELQRAYNEYVQWNDRNNELEKELHRVLRAKGLM